jgi:hypothetical protein
MDADIVDPHASQNCPVPHYIHCDRQFTETDSAPTERKTTINNLPFHVPEIAVIGVRTIYLYFLISGDRLCGLIARVPGYSQRSPVLYSRRYHIFRVAVGLERGPLIFMSINEELVERKIGGFGLENSD